MHQPKNKKIILAGDFNLPGNNWDQLDAGNDANVIFDIMLEHDIIQVVNQPTRVHGCCSSVLDLVFLPHCIVDYTVNIEHGLSDHKLVYVSMPISCHKVQKETAVHSYKDYSRADDASIIDHLEACLTDFDSSDVGVLWERFKSMCRYCLDKFVPNKRKKVHKEKPWMTRDIIHLKRKVKRLKKNRAPPNVIAQTNGSLASALHRSKERYFSTPLPSFIKTDPTKFWNYLSEKKKPVSQFFC